MRRKKLASKILSVLTACIMAISTPMSTLAVDAELISDEQQTVQDISQETVTNQEDGGYFLTMMQMKR